jgi:multiple sugar transport system permease protein
MMKYRKIGTFILKYAILAIATFIALLPVWMVITNSFKKPLDISVAPPKIFFSPVLSHYKTIFGSGGFGNYFRNSIIITGSCTAIVLIFSAMAAYGFLIGRSAFFHRITSVLLLSKMVMPITVLIPLYIMLNFIGLVGSYAGPVLAHAAVNSPFVIWMLLGFMRELPKELFDAARIDGCSRLGVFWRILFPLLAPAIGAAIILTAQWSWNELLFAIQLTKVQSYTLTVSIAKFVGAVSVDWGKSSAAASVTMVPVIILGFLMQKYLVRGLTAGAVKG